MHYPATFTPYADGSGQYGVTFVDLPGCVSIGENLEDAIRMGGEALSLHIGAMIGDGETPPRPSSLEEAEKQDRQAALRENMPEAAGTLYRVIHFEPALGVPENLVVRVTISLKPALLRLMDSTARELGITRSALISAACRKYCEKARSLDPAK